MLDQATPTGFVFSVLWITLSIIAAAALVKAVTDEGPQ